MSRHLSNFSVSTRIPQQWFTRMLLGCYRGAKGSHKELIKSEIMTKLGGEGEGLVGW